MIWFLIGCAGLDLSTAPEARHAPDALAATNSLRKAEGGFGSNKKVAMQITGEEVARDDDLDMKVDDGLVRRKKGKRQENHPVGELADGEEPSQQARIREWFPESFIWRPSLQTDATGSVTVDVLVPDQLTTWRLLALAHDGNGHQSGTEHRFDSVLPVSVDPLVPGWLYVGDELRVLGRASALGTSASGRVVLRADGALSGGGEGSVQLAPGDSDLVGAGIRADRSGVGTVLIEILGPQRLDGAERVVSVRPRGRRIDEQRGGLVPRTLTMKNTNATEERVLVRVFPGPLALFQSELDRISDRPPAGTSYAILQGVQELSEAAGIELDTARLRSTRLRAWQRLVKQARSPGASQAVRLLHGLGEPDDVLTQNLRNRLVRIAVEGQRGDGSWSSRDRSTVQQILVETASAVLALPADQEGPRLRGSGALERLLPNADDPFTAAWVLASGAVDEGFRAELEALVLKGITEVGGVHVLMRSSGVRDATGSPPTRAQELAVAVLALQHRDDLPWKGELVSALLQEWSAARGFGSGWADAIALSAVRVAMPTLDQPVQVKLRMDGVEVGTGSLDPKQPAVPVALEVATGGKIEITSEPAIPGLTFVLTHSSWVPFTGQESLPGVDVEVVMSPLVAGKEGMITLTIAAPSGERVELEQGLPAGTRAQAPIGRVDSHEIQADRVVMKTGAFGAGEVMTLRIPVTPQYAGVMHTPPLVVRAGGREVQVAPQVWHVGGGS